MLKGKKGIIFGIANDHSIAWGIAKKLHQNGADLAITYQNNTLLKRVKPLADKVNCNCLVECDVSKEENLNKALKIVKDKFCLLYTSPSPRDAHESRMPSSA